MIPAEISTAPTLGLAVIAKDEETTLPNLLASIEDAFDQVVLLDTGSTDGTIDVFVDWAQGQHRVLPFKFKCLEWGDDFAAARNAANDLLDTEWIGWADCDDVIRGAEHLRAIVAGTPPETAMIKFKGGYIDGHRGRERLARRGFERWYGRVHEGQPGNAVYWTEPRRVFKCHPWNAVSWVHSSTGEAKQARFGPKYQRNMRIIESWLAEMPGHPTTLGYRAVEELSRGDRETALGYYRDYLALPRVRKALGPRHIELALTVLPTITGLCQASSFVVGRPPLTWLLMDREPDWPSHPLCRDMGAALLDRSLVGATE